MPIFIKVLGVVFPVFSIIGLGYALATYKKLSLDSIIEVLLYITIPALVLSSLLKRSIMPEEIFHIAAAVCIILAITALITFLYLKATKKDNLRGLYLPTMFMNTGNIPFPVSLLAFGHEGLSIAVLFYVAISTSVYSLGIYIAKGKGGLTEIFKLPLIYVAIAGIFINMTDTQLPAPILTTVEMLGAATIPLMLISLGYQLYSTRIDSFYTSFACSGIRIFGGFLASLAAVKLLGITGLTAKIVILSGSMPSAVINFVLSHRYNVQGETVASVVALSTLMSIVTIPLLLMWLI